MLPLPELESFTIRQHGAVAVLTYNRLQTGNSLHSTVFKGLYNAMKWASTNPEIKVIVQTGTGKFFSTGRDMGSGDDNDIVKRLEIFRDINATFIKCEKVLIAAVNGPAVGYGTTSLGLYDLVYSVPHAVTFPAIMGHQKAMSLLLAGDRMSAEELYTAGLISKIIPADTNEEFMGKIMEIATRIASYPPRALAATKKLVEGDRIRELLEANDRECEGLKERVDDPESIEAFLSFAKGLAEKKKAKESKVKGPNL